MANDTMDNVRAGVCWANCTGATREQKLGAFFGTVMPEMPQEDVETFLKRMQPEQTDERTDEQILLSVRRAYEHPNLRPALQARIRQVAQQNKGMKPDIDMNYWCETCGSTSGKCHPDTGYCFICDTDNWEPHNQRDVL